MYNPPSFAEANSGKLHDFIEQFSFAILLTADGGEILASHLPLLLDRMSQPNGQLIGHMARANSQWTRANDQRVLAIFQGPHTYISPTWYEGQHVVPTWNYVTVHVRGRMRLHEDHADLLRIVRRYVEVYEAPMDAPWSVDREAPEFIDRLLNAIVGFTIDIESIEGKWKLSQNHDRTRRQRVIKALQAGGTSDQLRIAEMMIATLEES